MKNRILLFVTLVAVIASCKTLSTYYLKGVYREEPYASALNGPSDVLWDKAIRALEMKGIKNFSIISKENGVIVSEPFDFINNYTRENTKGELIDQNAFVVIGNFHTISGKQLPPDSIQGVVIVRFKQENGSAKIEVSITRLRFLYTYQKGSDIAREITDIPVKSTGMLEKFILKSVSE